MLTRFISYLVGAYQEWRRRENAFYELSMLDDRSLADLGISRAEIRYAVAKIPQTVKPLPPKAPTIRHAA